MEKKKKKFKKICEAKGKEVQPKVTKKTKEIKSFLSMEERSTTKMKLELRNMLETHVYETWREM
jgi:hypothetical protein